MPVAVAPVSVPPLEPHRMQSLVTRQRLVDLKPTLCLPGHLWVLDSLAAACVTVRLLDSRGYGRGLDGVVCWTLSGFSRALFSSHVFKSSF